MFSVSAWIIEGTTVQPIANKFKINFTVEECIWWGGVKGHVLLVMHWDLDSSCSGQGELLMGELCNLCWFDYSGPYPAKQRTFKSLLNICDPSYLKLVEFWLLKARIFSISKNYALYILSMVRVQIWFGFCLSFWWYQTQVHSSLNSACFLKSKYKPWMVLIYWYIYIHKISLMDNNISWKI